MEHVCVLDIFELSLKSHMLSYSQYNSNNELTDVQPESYHETYEFKEDTKFQALYHEHMARLQHNFMMVYDQIREEKV